MPMVFASVFSGGTFFLRGLRQNFDRLRVLLERLLPSSRKIDKATHYAPVLQGL